MGQGPECRVQPDANPSLQDPQPSALLFHLASYSHWQKAQGLGEKAPRPLAFTLLWATALLPSLRPGDTSP